MRAASPASIVTAHAARGAILASAAKVFSRQGIAATRVEDILVAAKIARRTFYRYFASKEEVLAALYEVWTAEMIKAVEDARARQPGAPLAAIHAGIDVFLGFYRAGPRAMRELVELAMRSDSLLAPRRRWARDQVVRLLDDAVHAADGRRLDPYLFLGLLGALEGLCLELGPDASASELDRVRKVLHALVDHALDLPRRASLPKRAA